MLLVGWQEWYLACKMSCFSSTLWLSLCGPELFKRSQQLSYWLNDKIRKNGNDTQSQCITKWKNARRRCKHCTGCSKAETKISPRHRPPSQGRGAAKLYSAGGGHYLHLQTQFGEDRCTQFRVIVVTDPPTNRQDRLQYTVLQLARSVMSRLNLVQTRQDGCAVMDEEWDLWYVCRLENTSRIVAGRYDFFIVSQSVRQGTVNPTCYDVIYDETLMPPNIAQRLTYKLCHLYYNWPVSVFTVFCIVDSSSYCPYLY